MDQIKIESKHLKSNEYFRVFGTHSFGHVFVCDNVSSVLKCVNEMWIHTGRILTLHSFLH